MQDGSGSLKRFEVSVFNQEVRDCEKKGRVHPSFDASWADLNFFTYESDSKEDVIRQIERRYPPRKGFVISDIIEIKEFEFVKPRGVKV
ncbi:hypothetical protein [Emcibacter sp.]|uniref:hypothetical protein n=1 Tax=Emcibacter sp. TaxID=1979954 RepID=UPI003A914C20